MHLRSDQYTLVDRDCPMNVDMHPADDLVEVTLGEYRIGGDTLRLLVAHPDACLRLTEALRDARAKLIDHLRVQETSQLDRTW
jgi:hypothetical protein